MNKQTQTLNEVEQRLLNENKQLREQLELVKTILNKRSSTQELSLKGSVETVLDERDKAQKYLYLFKQEIKVALNKPSEKELRDFLKNLYKNFERLYEQ